MKRFQDVLVQYAQQFDRLEASNIIEEERSVPNMLTETVESSSPENRDKHVNIFMAGFMNDFSHFQTSKRSRKHRRGRCSTPLPQVSLIHVSVFYILFQHDDMSSESELKIRQKEDHNILTTGL